MSPRSKPGWCPGPGLQSADPLSDVSWGFMFQFWVDAGRTGSFLFALSLLPYFSFPFLIPPIQPIHFAILLAGLLFY